MSKPLTEPLADNQVPYHLQVGPLDDRTAEDRVLREMNLARDRAKAAPTIAQLKARDETPKPK